MLHDDLISPTVQARFWRVPEGDTEVLEARFRTHSFSPHRHDRYVFGMVTRGVEGFRYRGQDHFTRAGNIAILEPDELHDGYAAVEDGWSYRMTYLEPALLEQAAAAAFGGGWSGLPGFRDAVVDDPALAVQCARLFATLDEPDALARSSEMLTVLTALVSRHADSRPILRPALPDPGDRRLARVRDRLLADPAVAQTLESLADLAGLSPYHLLRSFRLRYGQPPHAFHTEARLKLAEAALRRGVAIAEAAAASGFADQSHLTRAFKRYRGVTPGAFRAARTG